MAGCCLETPEQRAAWRRARPSVDGLRWRGGPATALETAFEVAMAPPAWAPATSAMDYGANNAEVARVEVPCSELAQGGARPEGLPLRHSLRYAVEVVARDFAGNELTDCQAIGWEGVNAVCVKWTYRHAPARTLACSLAHIFTHSRTHSALRGGCSQRNDAKTCQAPSCGTATTSCASDAASLRAADLT